MSSAYDGPQVFGCQPKDVNPLTSPLEYHQECTRLRTEYGAAYRCGRFCTRPFSPAAFCYVCCFAPAAPCPRRCDCQLALLSGAHCCGRATLHDAACRVCVVLASVDYLRWILLLGTVHISTRRCRGMAFPAGILYTSWIRQTPRRHVSARAGRCRSETTPRAARPCSSWRRVGSKEVKRAMSTPLIRILVFIFPENTARGSTIDPGSLCREARSSSPHRLQQPLPVRLLCGAGAAVAVLLLV